MRVKLNEGYLVPLCDELYIITTSGICIYSRARNKYIDKKLFGGFMAALNLLSKQLKSSSVHAFNLGTMRYVISPTADFLFVARTDLKTKETAVQNDLEEMQKIFFEKCPREILNNDWETNLAAFEILNEFYDRFLLDAGEKMRSAIW